MESGVFKTLFPQGDFSLIAVILGLPLLGALVNGVWGKRLGKQAVRFMALTAVGLSFLASVATFLALKGLTGGHGAGAEGAHGAGEHVRLVWSAWEWMRTGTKSGVGVPIAVQFSVDALNSVMMLVVTGVGFLIHLYSSSYMENDPGYARFFAYLNLFIFSMLVLILGDNLPLLFVGWEGVGLCSYLLIGFWYENPANASAGKKAFIANRIGDFGLLCGMFLLAYYTGSLDWVGLEQHADALVSAGAIKDVHVWPLGGGQYTGALSFLQPSEPVTITAATAVGLALFLGCTGKSAQIPLYVWLPDAMAGPTPVSALIHAATMVTAGIYLICRLSFIFVLAPGVMMLIACTGAATALLAATIALVQNDIKKVLAYSTVSQLGFMFLGVGVGAFTAGFFHVFTHAFFKACLFLGAGSVIHAMHARIHNDVDAQDVRNMGGLRQYMPVTFWTFTISTAAIIGLPLTSGFFSKDEILFKAVVSSPIHPFAKKLAERNLSVFTEPPPSLGMALYAVGVLAATMTAFYMCRLWFLTFFGDFRGWAVGASAGAGHDEAHGHDDHHGHEDLTKPGPAPHESPWAMTLPLVILAAFAAFAGWLNAGLFHLEPMGHWLDPVFEAAVKVGVREKEHAHDLMWPLAAGGVAAFAIGSGLAAVIYVVQKGEPARRLAEMFGPVYRFLMDKWRVDEFYDYTVLSGVDALADTATVFDQYVVDGVLARLTANVVKGLGLVLRAFQNGVVHVYGAVMVVGLACMTWFFVAPHAEVTIRESNGDYTLEAAPGVGYAYRWDKDGDGKPESADFGKETTVKVTVEAGATKVVRLDVKNAFGLQGSKEIRLSRSQSSATLSNLGQR